MRELLENENQMDFRPQSHTETIYVSDANLTLVDIIIPQYGSVAQKFNRTPIRDKKLSLEQVEALFSEPDRATLHFITNKVRTIAQTGEPTYFEYPLTRPDGTPCIIICYGERKDDGLNYLHSFCMDARTIAKGRLLGTRQLANDVFHDFSANVWIRHFDKSDTVEGARYVYFNPKAREEFGTEQVIDSPYWDQAQADSNDLKALASTHTLPPHRVFCHSSEGEVKAVLLMFKHRMLSYLDGHYVLTIGVNVTERYRMEMKLKEQYALLKTMYEGLPFGLIAFDAEGKLLTMNSQAMTIYVVKDLNRVLGTSIFGGSQMSEKTKISILTEKDVSFEINYDVCTGMVIHQGEPSTPDTKQLYTRILAIFDENNQRNGYLMICEDRTEHAKQQRAMEVVRSRYSGINDSITSGLIVYDAQVNVVDCNKMAMQILGITDKALFCQQGIPQVYKEINGTYNLWQDASQGLVLHEFDFSELPDYQCYWSNRTERLWLEGRLSPLFDDNRQSLGYLFIFNDVTERERRATELKEKNRKLLEFQRFTDLEARAANILQWELNLHTHTIKILTTDPRFPKEGIHFDQYLQFVHPDDIKRLQPVIDRLVKGELTDEECVLKFRVKLPFHKSVRHVELTGLRLYDADGNPDRYAGFRRDVTDWVELNESLKEKNKELTRAKLKAEESDRLKTAFLANMSHEIRTPLNAIVGFSDLLTQQPDGEERDEYIKIIKQNNELLLNLVGDILDLSKIEAGTVDVSPAPFDMAECLNEVRQTIEPRCTNPLVQIIKEEPYAHCMVELDIYRVKQLYLNLLTNALKFTYEGEVRMGYAVEDDGIRIYVADTGIGIAKDNYDKIFSRFEKIDSFSQGAGLGLTICKAVVEACGGTIDFTSEVGKGSTFWAWLPTRVEV